LSVKSDTARWGCGVWTARVAKSANQKATAMNDHRPTRTTSNDLIDLLLQDGLGEGLSKTQKQQPN
jgi:hypothetical protein